jgi:16S rRNA (adenine1518-N6/adenine1519-N6)-dimethyltransferase
MTSPRRLLKAWQVRPRKSMGQNFLADPGVASTIIQKGGFLKDDTIVEIGAGTGSLTIPLAQATRHVFAVEPDRQIAGLLGTELSAAGISNVTVIQEDILACDLSTLVRPLSGPLKAVGNLPYHISSPVLAYLVERRRMFSCAVLMFQKELAERLLAKPGSKSYGRLSVLVSYCASVRQLLQVKASAFYPRPKVDSTVVAIVFHDPPPIRARDEEFLFQVVRAAFGKRRKTLKNALAAGDLGVDTAHLSRAFSLADIDPQRRAETLSVEDFVRLSDILKSADALTGM